MSGKAIAFVFAGLAVAIVATILVLTPRLQRDAAALLGPEHDVLQVGEIGGAAWTVTASSGDGLTCLETAVDGERAADTCLTGAQALDEYTVAAPAGPADRYVFAGIVPADIPQVRVELSTGEDLVPRVYRPGGYRAGFFTTTVAPDVAVERVVGMDLRERELAVRSCDGPLATVGGLGAGCTTYSGGQG